MKGTRLLDNNEIRRVSACFTGIFATRNRGLFMLGVSTGGRISELLSLTIGDVYQNRAAVTDLLFDKSIVKGGEVSRAVPVNRDGRLAIDVLVVWHREQYGNTQASRPLFPSRNGQGNPQRMSRRTAHDVLKKAFEDAQSTEQGNGKAMTGHDGSPKIVALLENQIQDLKAQLEKADAQLQIATAEKSKILDLLSAEKEEKRALMPPPEEKNQESKGNRLLRLIGAR